jgi:uncharacterized protein YchJ
MAFYGLDQTEETVAYIIATIQNTEGQALDAFLCWNTFMDQEVCMDALMEEIEKHAVSSIVTVDGLLDMEICGHCVNVTGRVTNRRMPAVAGAKIGRNDVCPYGSGKKYKKCCGT